MKTDALSDLIRTVGDDSSPEHKAIYHLWSALDDVLNARRGRTKAEIVEGGFVRAASALTSGRLRAVPPPSAARPNQPTSSGRWWTGT